MLSTLVHCQKSQQWMRGNVEKQQDGFNASCRMRAHPHIAAMQPESARNKFMPLISPKISLRHCHSPPQARSFRDWLEGRGRLML